MGLETRPPVDTDDLDLLPVLLKGRHYSILPVPPKRSVVSCMSIRRLPSLLLLALAVLSAGCALFRHSDAPDTAAITTDTFNGPLPMGASIVFGFKVTTEGMVSVTLTSVTPATSVALGLGIGTSNDGGQTCALTNSTSAAVAGSAAQLTATLSPGPYCVKVYDVGHLTAASSVALSVAHP